MLGTSTAGMFAWTILYDYASYSAAYNSNQEGLQD